MNIFDTATLIGVVRNLKRPSSFLLDTFFPYVALSDDKFVAIDVEFGVRGMAPFSDPSMQGTIIEETELDTNQFTPAYIKPKTPLDFKRPIRRQIGESIGGTLSAGDREMYHVVDTLAKHIEYIDRRLEWMASSALQDGTILVSGDGFQDRTVDFKRASELTVTLSGTDVWADTLIDTNIKPTSDIEKWCTLILKKSGAVVTDVVFTPKSWERFQLDQKIFKGAIQMPVLNPSGNVVNPGTQVQVGGVFKGYWGNLKLWLYNDWFVDPKDGVEKPMIKDGSVILSGPQLEGTRAFGAIMDPAFNYGPMAYAPKSWLQEDPAQRFVMTQSAPMIIPSRVNASLCATVA